jgi:hypothetical protein
MKISKYFALCVSVSIANLCCSDHENRQKNNPSYFGKPVINYLKTYAEVIKCNESDIEIMQIRRDGEDLDQHIDISNESKTFYELGIQKPADFTCYVKDEVECYSSTPRKE